MRTQKIPIALAIAGSDSGGGAGVQADLKTFAALGVHGTSAITCLTAQNPARVSRIEPCSPLIIRRQIETAFAKLPPAAIKTGMLFSAEIIRAVASCLKQRPNALLVIDPVMISTSGRRLLKPDAMKVLQQKLFPLASLITPNLDEASVLLGAPLRSLDDMRKAARELHRRFGCATLIKGGHLPNATRATDILFDGKKELRLTSPFIPGLRLHGTGCTYSAAITAHLALGASLPQAVMRAKRYITHAILHRQTAGEHTVLNHFH